MKIYEFKNGQLSSDSIKNKSFSQLKEFGATKAEFDKLVKEKVIILNVIEKKEVKKTVKKKEVKETK